MTAPDEDGLTPQERRLVDCAAKGEVWGPGPDWPRMGPPTRDQDASRTIRAELIRCLATGAVWPTRFAPWPVHSQGLMAREARIAGELDLQGSTLKPTLGFHRSVFDRRIKLSGAEARTISFRACLLLEGIDAQSAAIKGNLFLSDGFTAKGEVSLIGTRIEGLLDCSGGQFENEGRTALDGDAMTVGADVFLCDGFIAKGEVNLKGAKIEGQLACSGGQFENEGKIALNGDAMTVGADVFLRDGFTAKGEVILRRAKIEGQLSCGRGHFENEGKIALNGAAMIVGADVLLQQGFISRGEVNLVRANIEGHLGCDGGRFENEGKTALNGDSITVDAAVFLRDGFSAKGTVNFNRATVKGNLRCVTASFSRANGDALNLTQAEIGAGLFLHNLKPLEGTERGMDGRLILEQTKCRTYSDDESAWPEPGKLLLDGFAFERFHNCATSWETRAKWLHLQPDDHKGRDFRPQPWIQAAKVLRDMGHERDARELSVERERVRAKSDRIKRKNSNSRWLRRTGPLLDLWNWILRATIGYGYMPWRVLYWSAGIVAFGWLVFAAGGDLGYMSPRDGVVQTYLASHPEAQLPDTYIRFNAFVYALDAFLPIIELDESQGWEPDDEQHGFVRPLAADEGLITCTKRLMTGQNMEWRRTAPSNARSCGYAADTGVLATLSSGTAWLFRHGAHRAVDWLLELLGWALISLFIAGMSGIMKKE
jgi:hypothetical protein